jgi:aminocarboxymuconate-semialdehyde decarboxylase
LGASSIEVTTPAFDVHTHFVPERLPTLPTGSHEKTWPSMAAGDRCDHRHVMVDGAVYRTVTEQCWSAQRRIDDMRTTGVTHQVLSPMPELLSYWMTAENAACLHRYLNEQMARIVLDHPAQFSALAAVPLQDVDAAILELEYAAAELHLSGVEIGTNVNGVPIGAPQFRPFFAAAERAGMAVFVHAIRPAGVERLVGSALLQPVVAFPGEVGLAAASVITTNLMAAHAELRLAFSHGGGSLALLLPRMQHAWETFDSLRHQVPEAPVEQARRLFYDTLVYDRDTLLFLLRVFGTNALMIGSDYPFSIMEQNPLARVTETAAESATLAKLRSENARRFLARHSMAS